MRLWKIATLNQKNNIRIALRGIDAFISNWIILVKSDIYKKNLKRHNQFSRSY